MGFILGIIVVVVAIMAYVMFAGDGSTGGGADDVNITIEGAGDAVEGAADAVEGAAEGAADAADGDASN